jgi:plasmid stability protein
MTLHISITPAVEAKLRKRAAAVGKGVNDFVREAVEEMLAQDTSFEKILAPVHDAFRKSGMSQRRAIETFEHAREDAWRAKQPKPRKAS